MPFERYYNAVRMAFKLRSGGILIQINSMNICTKYFFAVLLHIGFTHDNIIII